MVLRRKGLVAKPGTYKYGDNEEIKDAEELKQAAMRQPIVMLTLGHPVDGMPSAKDVIGTLKQNWNDEHQRVDGEFWFNDDVPDSIKDKIENYEPIPISPGFMIDDIEEGVQRGIVYTHVAVLEDEDPRCPLGECGVNLRMDSKEEMLFRYDQKTELENPAPEETLEPEPVEAEPEPEIMPTTPRVEVIEEPTPVEAEPEVIEPVPEEVQREPETIIPVSKPKSSFPEGMSYDGKTYEYVPKAYRKQTESE